MTFTSKNLHSKRSGMGFIKGATLFFLGMSCIFFITQAFNVTPNITNAVQYIGKILLTASGSNFDATGIILDGANGDGYFKGTVTIDGSVNGATVTANTICLNNDINTPGGCRVTWPTGGIGGAGTPAGATTQIQFNNVGAFGASANLVWDNLNGRLGVNTNSPDTSLDVLGMAKIGIAQIISGSSILSSILGGNTNEITHGSYSSIVGGLNNLIFGHDKAVILGGEGNIIHAGITSSGGGVTMLRPSYETILNGYYNEIISSPYSLIAGGREVTVASKPGVFIRSDSVITGVIAGKRDTFLINSTNGVGINTNNPTYTLDVQGSGDGNFSGQFATVRINNTDPVVPIPELSLSTNGSDVSYFGFTPAGTERGTQIKSVTNQPMRLYTNNTERVTIKEDGTVGIGATSPTEKLEVNGNIKLTGTGIISAAASSSNQIYLRPNGYVGILKNPSYQLDVNGTVGATTFTYTSDRQLKKDLTIIKNPLEKILALNGYLFTWKADNTKAIGVIAQEVEKVFPELVNTNNDGYKSVEYGNLVAPLIEAIKELNKKVDVQAKEIKNLQSKINN